MGTWLFVMGLVIGLWMLTRSVLRLSYIVKLRRSLQRGEHLTRKLSWGMEDTL